FRTVPLLRPPTFFFDIPAPPPIYTLSLHDALPISRIPARRGLSHANGDLQEHGRGTQEFQQPVRGKRSYREQHQEVHRLPGGAADRKSTRLNSSHVAISYAVFCLKKKKKIRYTQQA